MAHLNDRIILGIDPGTNIMGYGIIHNKGNKIELITMDVVKLGKMPDHPMKLKGIFEAVDGLISKHRPDELAIEAPFYGKNVQSMLKLGRAQGVAMAAAISHSVPVFEYSPRKVKQSVTGRGNASKEQVAAMLFRLMGISEAPDFLDATDALAVAVCHFYQKPASEKADSYTGWQAFINKNPDRLI